MNLEPLADFLRGHSWRHRFDDDALRLGQAFAPKIKLLGLEETAENSFILRAELLGGAASIDLWESGSGWDMETACGCDGGAFCPHAAAVLIRAAKERNFSRLGGIGMKAALAENLREISERMEDAPEACEDTPVISPAPEFQLHVTRHPVDKATRLLLQSLGQKEADRWISAEASVSYDGHRTSLRGSRPAWTSRVSGPGGSPAVIRHDAAAENAAARQLSDAGLSSLRSNQAWKFILQIKSRENPALAADIWFPDPGRISPDAFWHRFRGETMAKLEAGGWKITVDDNVGHRVFDANPDAWNTHLIPLDGGWFSLSVGFDVAGERHDLLPILANLLESGLLEETLDRPDSGYVYAPLENGDALKLPIGRVRRILRNLGSLIDPKFPGKTRLHPLDAAALAENGGLGIDLPPDLAVLAGKLRDFSGIPAVPPPPDLQAELRDYQLAGFRWMQFLARHGLHGILADDMGLGKTLQTLAHILAEKNSGAMQGRPALVVAPTSVVPNWRAEARRFAPGLRLLVLNGPDRRKYHRSIPYADLVLTSYALLHRDADKLRCFSYHLIILDEAQNIKNPRAKVAQAACSLHGNHRLCLSGTPVENHLGELWSLMRFLVPGFLGSEEQFNERFRKPIEKSGDADRSALLKERVAPLILRRTKDQVAKELPPKTELVHLIELHTAQKDLYETVRATMNKRVREAIAASGGPQFQIVFLDALLKLRQICCDPRLLPPDFSSTIRESAKLDFLIGLLDVLLEEGRRILLFSQFTTMLALIEAHLKARGIPHLLLTGSSKDRGKLVEDFQTGKFPLFLISLKAGGTGLNLTAADTVIHYDPWWNPAAEAQATDRAYRIGQKNPVFIHKLLCQDTVEERIHRLQQEKARLAGDLLGDADIAGKLDASMIRKLLE